MEIIEDQPCEKSWIEKALQENITKEELTLCLRKGLEKEIRFFWGEKYDAVTHKGKSSDLRSLHDSYKEQDEILLKILNEEGLEAYLAKLSQK